MIQQRFFGRVVLLLPLGLVLTPAACGTLFLGNILGPVTGPIVDPFDLNGSNDPFGNPNAQNDAVELSCPMFPSTLTLAPTSETPPAVLSELQTITAPPATFTLTPTRDAGTFGDVSQIEITATLDDLTVIITFRAGTNSGGILTSGNFFTDAYTPPVGVGSNPDGDSEPAADPTARPTVSMITGSRRCDSSAGDLLQIFELETDPLAGSSRLVKQFRATFRLGCIQGCISFVQ